MDKFLFKKLLKLPRFFGQKILKNPKSNKAVISDLFLWRLDDEWDTFYEILDYSSVFFSTPEKYCHIIFFDRYGNQIYERKVSVPSLERKTIKLSELLPQSKRINQSYGSFCVIHPHTPKIISEENSFLTDRGYSAFTYKKCTLKSYLHGNMDAIDSNLNLLGGTSLIMRNFNLQYYFEPYKKYEILLTNNTPKDKKIILTILSKDKKTIINKCLKLKPRELFIYEISQLNINFYCRITSRIFMARPIIFSYESDKIDVFHA